MQFLVPPQYRAAAGIYAIRNSIDARLYVCSAQTLYARYTEHSSRLNVGNHHAKRLQAFVAENGIKCLRFELLEAAELGQNLGVLESKWIEKFKAHEARFGFNGNATARYRVAALAKEHISLALAPEDKEFIEQVAKARGLSMTALLRTLAYDEGRRLGIEPPKK